MGIATITNIIDRDRIELTVNGVVERLGEILCKNPTVFLLHIFDKFFNSSTPAQKNSLMGRLLDVF
jgi:hypothetical protein